MPHVDLHGHRTWYEVSGQGEPVLFVHGGYGGPTSSLRAWPRPVAGLLDGWHRVITYDRRNAGRSAYDLRGHDLAALAADAVALLDHLGVARAVVIGSSAGGMVALRLALDHPDRVAALALLNTGPSIMHPAPSGIARPFSGPVLDRLSVVGARERLVARARADGDAAAVASAIAEFRAVIEPPGLPPADRAPWRDLERRLVALDEATLVHWAAGAIRNMEALLGVDLAPRLGEVTAPTLVVHGDVDLVVPIEYGALLAEGIPGAEWRPVAGAGHGVLLDGAAQVALVDWLARVGA